MILMANRIGAIKRVDFQQFYSDLVILGNAFAAIVDGTVAKEGSYSISGADFMAGYEVIDWAEDEERDTMAWFVRPKRGMTESMLDDTVKYGTKTKGDLEYCKTFKELVAAMNIEYFDSRRLTTLFGFEKDSQLCCDYPARQYSFSLMS